MDLSLSFFILFIFIGKDHKQALAGYELPRKHSDVKSKFLT